jgi:ADP-L-glycero-D-manno-heptose 6-epimerase
MAILVTGAAGFIGTHLVESLRTEGFSVVECDIAPGSFKNPKDIILNFEKYDIEKIYHLGAISSTTEYNIEKLVNSNILLAATLIQKAIEQNIPFVYASSASVYGRGTSTDDFREDKICAPLNYYAISKYSVDMLAMQKLQDNSKAQIVGLRYYNVYGEGETKKKNMSSPIHQFFKQAKSSGHITLFSNSDNYKRDFVHVTDVVSITKDSSTYPSGIYNVGTGTARSFATIAKLISGYTQAPITEIPFPKNLRGKYQEYTCSNNEKINKVSRITTRISLEDGIRSFHEK